MPKKEPIRKVKAGSLTISAWENDGRVNYTLQRARLVDKKDSLGKIVLSTDGTEVEKKWEHDTIGLSKEDLTTIMHLLEDISKEE